MQLTKIAYTVEKYGKMLYNDIAKKIKGGVNMKKITLEIRPENKRSHINREIYGHFSEHLGRCIYNGLYVGEDSSVPNKNGVRKDVIEALKAIKIPVLRWPGGCFADEYHWKDGIGEKSGKYCALPRTI